VHSIATRVLENWRQRHVSLVTPYLVPAIKRRLVDAGLPAGSDFVTFLAVVGGMVDDEMDPDLWSMWNLDKIIIENKRIGKEGVYFADWLIHSHLHVARLESSGVTSVWSDGFDGVGVTKVAATLKEFLERYLARDQSIGIYFEDEKAAKATYLLCLDTLSAHSGSRVMGGF
jgi:hypothetical protein